MSLPPHPSATPVPLCHCTQSQCHPGATMSLYPIPVPPHPCPLYPDGPTLAGLTPWGAEPPSPPRSDFGYYRPENQSVCVEQPELKGHDLEFCLYGRRELLRTSGYNPNPTPRGGGRGGVLGAHSTSSPPLHPPFCSRYRKIPGDKCSGGESPSREETDMKKKCTSTLLSPGQLVGAPLPPRGGFGVC